MLTLFNPFLTHPEPFSVTRPPKEGVTTPLWNFYNKRPMQQPPPPSEDEG